MLLCRGKQTNKLIFPYRAVNPRWDTSTNIHGHWGKSLAWFRPIREKVPKGKVKFGAQSYARPR